MSLNSPDSLVTITPDKTIRLKINGCQRVFEAGVEAQIPKSVNYLCAEPITLEPASCPDQKWFVTIGAGEAYKAEVPSTDGTPSRLCVKSCECLAYAYGTESKPLDVVVAAEIKENAPDLLDAGEHTLPLSVEGEAINAIALVNCSADAVKVQITWKGCTK